MTTFRTPSRQHAFRRAASRAGAVLASLAGAIVLTAAASPADTLVEVTGSTQATLPPHRSTDVQLSVLVSPADGVTLTEILPTVTHVSRGTVDLGDPDAFATVDWADSPPARLLLTVKGGATDESGTYDVEIALTHGDVTQVLVWQVTRDPTEVSAPSKVTVTHEIPLEGIACVLLRMGCLDHMAGTVDPSSIRVAVGDNGWLANVTARQLEATEGPVIVATAAENVTGPGANLDLAIEIDGTEPGRSDRTLQLTSPQLAGPLDIPVSVTTRLTDAALLLAIAFGLVVGTLVRHLIPFARERTSRLAARDDLIARIRALRAASPDTQFREVADQALAAIPPARRQDFDAVLAAQADAVAAAYKDLEARLLEVSSDYERVRLALRSRAGVSPALEAACNTAERALSDGAALVQSRDAAGARVALGPLQDALTAVRDAVDAWRTDVADVTERARSSLHSDDAGEGIAARLDVLGTFLEATTTEDESRDAIALADEALAGAHRIGSYGDVINDAIDRIADTMLDAAQVAEFDDEARAHFARSGGLARATAQAWEPGLDIVEHLLSPLASALADRERALAAIRGVDSTAAALLSAGNVDAAAAAVAQRTRQTLSGESDREGEVGSTNVASAPPIGADAPASGLVALASIGTQDLRVARIAFRAAGWAVGLVEFLLAAVVAMLVGWWTLSDAWLGTTADFAMAFTWAFAVDLSVAGASQLVADRRQAFPPASATPE